MKSIFRTKKQYGIHEKRLSKRTINKIVNIINCHAKINFNWSNEKYLACLNEEHLNSISTSVAGKAQRNLVKVLSPYVNPKIATLFGLETDYKIRVSAQIKGVWNEKERKAPRKGKLVNDIFYESNKVSNIYFPTRPHQDLDNNGFRSSHTLIFYFQLTGCLENACPMRLGKIKNNKIGILENDDRLGYPNEITERGLKQISWDIKNLFKPGEVGLMSGIVPHRTFHKSELPRIALNIKIQPTNLNYLNLIYGYDLSSARRNTLLEDNLDSLLNILKKGSKINNALSFEKGITELLLGKKDDFIKSMKELHLFKISNEQIYKIGAASILKKTSGQIEYKDIKSIINPIKNIKHFSCAESILRTVT